MGVDRKFRLPRLWSNKELRKIAPLFSGEIVNVSAGEDVDKEGNYYESYFINKKNYYLTNYSPGSFRGYQGRDNEYLVDLTGKVPQELSNKFDVVFNHTTLEHIYDVNTAFSNLCKLSKDVVIIVVPFCQIQHENEGYEDFWRFTPTCVRRLFEKEGFKVVYEAANQDFNAGVYLFFVAARDPLKWQNQMPPYEPIKIAGQWIGAPKLKNKNKIWNRFKMLVFQ